MSDRKKHIENTLLAIGIGTLLTGATYGIYSYWKSRSQEEPYSEWPSHNHETAEKRPKGEVCPICLEGWTSSCTTLSCQHKFHKKCITQWKAINKTCPVCRMPIRQP